MRITVQDVFEYLAGGMTENQILEDFPELTRDDINALLRLCGRPRAEALRGAGVKLRTLIKCSQASLAPKTTAPEEPITEKADTPFGFDDTYMPTRQGGWRWCRKCQGFFFVGNPDNKGTCPAGGVHDVSAGGRYAMP